MEQLNEWEGPDGNTYLIPDELWEWFMEDVADAEESGEYMELTLEWSLYIKNEEQ